MSHGSVQYEAYFFPPTFHTLLTYLVLQKVSFGYILLLVMYNASPLIRCLAVSVRDRKTCDPSANQNNVIAACKEIDTYLCRKRRVMMLMLVSVLYR